MCLCVYVCDCLCVCVRVSVCVSSCVCVCVTTATIHRLKTVNNPIILISGVVVSAFEFSFVFLISLGNVSYRFYFAL